MLEDLDKFVVTYKTEPSICGSLELEKIHEGFVYDLKLSINLLQSMHEPTIIVVFTKSFK